MFDVHTHCQNPSHIGSVLDADMLPAYARRPHKLDWNVTPDRYDRAMRESGVDGTVVFGVRALAAGIDTPNEHVEWFCNETTTETIGFMALDLTADDLFEQLEDGIARGLRGIKLYPTTSLFDPSDTEHDAFYERVVGANLVIMWHTGATPVRSGRLALSHPLLIDEVARRHPSMIQVMAHMSHPWQREAIITIRKNPNVFADVSALNERPFDAYHALVRAQEWGVVDKLLFGSDFPHYTPGQAIDGLREVASMRPTDLPHVEPATIDHLVESNHLATLGLA